MDSQEFTETTGAVARAGDATAPTVRLYGDLGLIPFITISNGTRLHRKDAGKRVREILLQRLAARNGRNRKSA
jgi:DNA-binding transcriptional MerR regulator